MQDSLERLLKFNYWANYCIDDCIDSAIADVKATELERMLTEPMSKALLRELSYPLYSISFGYGRGVIPDAEVPMMNRVYGLYCGRIRGLSFDFDALTSLETMFSKILADVTLEEVIKNFCESKFVLDKNGDKHLIECAVRVFNLPKHKHLVTESLKSNNRTIKEDAETIASWQLATESPAELSIKSSKAGLNLLQSHFRITLFKNQSVITTFTIDTALKRFEFVQSFNTYDHLEELGFEHRQTVANIFSEFARKKQKPISKDDANEYPFIDASCELDVSEEEIIAAAHMAFGESEHDPFEKIIGALSQRGFKTKGSYW